MVENMFYVNEIPWHGLGVKLDTPPNSKKAIIQAGLDWKVNLTPINIGDKQYKNYLAIQRENTDDIYGIVKPGWTPLQNIDAFHFFDPIVRSGLAEYHTAGSLKNGEKVWILAKLKSDPFEVAKDDFVEKYLLLSNGHNGKLGVRISFTPIRVVCNNTLTMAEDSTTQTVRIMHSLKVNQNLDNLREVIDIANRRFALTFKQYERMANRGIKNLEHYIIKSLYPNKEMPLDSEQIGRTVNQIVDIANMHPTNTLPSIKGTVWAAYNAMTFWIDHNRGRTNTRLDQAWFGNGKAIKDRAYQEAVLIAA